MTQGQNKEIMGRQVDAAGYDRLVEMGLDVEQFEEAVSCGFDDTLLGNDMSWGRQCDPAAVGAFNERLGRFNMGTAISRSMDRRG